MGRSERIFKVASPTIFGCQRNPVKKGRNWEPAKPGVAPRKAHALLRGRRAHDEPRRDGRVRRVKGARPPWAKPPGLGLSSPRAYPVSVLPSGGDWRIACGDFLGNAISSGHARQNRPPRFVPAACGKNSGPGETSRSACHPSWTRCISPLGEMALPADWRARLHAQHL
jgi:hypothetical protein